MKKIIIILIFMVPFVTLSSIWEKADGYYKYSRIYNIFPYNNNLFASDYDNNVYKLNSNEWNKLDTGFFAEKGIVHNLNQKDDIIFSCIGRKMFLSYDGGRSWKEIDTLGGQIRYTSVAIVDSTIYMQSNSSVSLYKMEKGKDTLEKVFLDESKSDSISADIIIPYNDFIFAVDTRNNFDGTGKEGQFYSSKDKGKTWNLSKTMKKQISCLHIHNSTLFAFTLENDLFISKDYGETWTTDTSININVIKAVSYKNNIITVGNGVNVSTDNGVTWKVSAQNGLAIQSCKDITIINDTLFCLTSNSIIYYSTDGGAMWNRKSPRTDDFSFNFLNETKDTLFSIGEYTIYYSVNHGETWDMYSDSLYFKSIFLVDLAINDSIFVVVNQHKTYFYISKNNGNSWKLENIGIITTKAWIREIVIFGGRILVCTYADGNFISKDKGITWEKYNDEVLKNDVSIYKSLRINKTDVLLFSDNGIYKTYDDGLSWEFEKIENENNFVNKYSFIDGNNVYNYNFKLYEIYKSTDLGRTWATLELNLEPGLIWTHIISYNGSLILLTKTDVFVSDNDGKDWRKYEIDLLTPDGKNLYFDNGIVSDDYLVLTSSSGIWRAKLSDLGIVKSSVESEIEGNNLYTYPPYPNPAKSEVKVLFYGDINISMTVDDISIYDITGKKIIIKNNLRIEKQDNYKGNIIWDCSTAQAGIYLINIKHGTEEKAVKVVVE